MIYKLEGNWIKYATLQGIVTAGEFAQYLKFIRKLKASWAEEEQNLTIGAV